MPDEYEIRKDVPMPASKGKSGLCATLRKMTCGNSITIPAEQQLSVYTCARSVGAKIKTQKEADGTVTVWRTDRAAGPEPAAESGAGQAPGFKPIQIGRAHV